MGHEDGSFVPIFAFWGQKNRPFVLKFLTSHVVGHIVGDDHRDFHHAANLAVLAPRRLVDHLLDALLIDGVAVDGVGLDHVADFLLRLRAVAGHEVLTQHGATFLVKGGA